MTSTLDESRSATLKSDRDATVSVAREAMIRLLSAAGLLAMAMAMLAAAEEPGPPPRPVTPPAACQLRTIMCDRGEEIFHDDFDATTPLGAWGGYSAGEWLSGNGVLSVTYVGGHSLYHEQVMPMKDIIMQMAFRFDEGVGTITMGMEGGPTGHCLRWNFHRESVDLQRMPGVGKDGHDLIDSTRVTLEAGRWYTMVVELCGTDLLVTIDETTLLYGSSDGIDCDKHSIILGADASSGRHAWFSRCAVWRATAKRDWPRKRETVRALMKRRADATPRVVAQLLRDDPGEAAPAFTARSVIPRVARAEEQIAGGQVESGCAALTKLATDKEPTVATAATADLAVVEAWRADAMRRIDALDAAGDAYAAAGLAMAMARFHPGEPGAAFRDRATQLKKQPAYTAGSELQALAEVPYEGRRDPRFAGMVDAFIKKHAGTAYVQAAQRLIVQ